MDKSDVITKPKFLAFTGYQILLAMGLRTHASGVRSSANIFKPTKFFLSKFAKPMAKKALESGISHAGDKLGKKAAEKSGDIIMNKLRSMKRPPKTGEKGSQKVREESTDMILNRLISGTGIKKKIRKTII